ncbi:uncharacterized protein LOC128960141 [Oppia nitens]|uniref:uncharacterized protein LOC128960141 n=1 Tax=Oppia nitens TaxID=1686743 RepID=UPI0023DA8B33|nr:uncharacterized protein LOC128960141 [Oppia nitens]
MNQLEHSSSFKCKKWTLFTLSLLTAIGMVVGCIMFITLSFAVDQMGDKLESRNHQFNDWHLTSTVSSINDFIDKNEKVLPTKNYIIPIVLAFGIIGIAFQLIGMIGAVKQHYGMCMTYSILYCLGTVGSLVSAIKSPQYVGSLFVNLGITLLAFSYARDCNQIEMATKFPMTSLTGTVGNNVTIIEHPAYPPQYSNEGLKGWKAG